ncbi:MAG: 1-deoxy-D-xylulose-5-phosphate reductoisomerase [Porticoccaceae bacterium]|nr:1-deoxy-D-xylulose-5-phosphate reductoisomerase [Pseudomonadales bacterium]MCP5171910.1 1-deoxy-D-xylulose-5-phosphate reductoisomerase [Pseudomonadales bacterium]
MQKVTILGATGSIGVSTLDVLARHPESFEVFALTGHSRIAELAVQCRTVNPRYAVVADRERATELEQHLKGYDLRTEVLSGVENLSYVAGHAEVDVVMAAIVGAAGLDPTLAAAAAAKKILLANKEVLVMAGAVFMDVVEKSGAVLLPVDSEHNAIFQCLPDGYGKKNRGGVSKILLSASGGPFRNTALQALSDVTPEQACAHPNWDMGRKISVDSATMMNKGLELIEACWLFDVSPEQVEVVIHPQSVVHSMVSYQDGSVLAQLGNPDMRTPIAHALAWPERMDSGVDPLDIVAIGQLAFEAPDLQRFPCLALAMQAAALGGVAPAVLNAANEIAVAAFLDESIGFMQIAEVVAGVMKDAAVCADWNAEPITLDAIKQADLQARNSALALVSERVNQP